ncbi:(S)-2-haloacid dehalogenase [Penicillium chrysogenum]|jgi:2-haloacid dehalogenase|uniref:Pc17g00450 protein n=2 Tax=Penicillium chrysogenum species complex TaxID=254878 RepID=B6HAX6_PENRW|nr:(S)-2-haloacid dehalogenase [Penicillium chrysogenum]CAP79332.1 Pc17g00450 [Penicillium rubens Wisconsin 54-1255]
MRKICSRIRNSLLHAPAGTGEQLDENVVNRLVNAYDDFKTFSDVNPMLRLLAADPNLREFVFFNGTRTIISNSVFRSKDLSPRANVFEDIIFVHVVKWYKLSQASYLHLAEQTVNGPCQMRKLWLISSNPFDIVGARSMGMNAIWVDRAGVGWKAAVVPDLQPTATVNSLEHIVEEVRAHRE